MVARRCCEVRLYVKETEVQRRREERESKGPAQGLRHSRATESTREGGGGLLAAGCWVLGAGCGLRAAGCWLSGAGYVLGALVLAGCWVLAAGYVLVLADGRAAGGAAVMQSGPATKTLSQASSGRRLSALLHTPRRGARQWAWARRGQVQAHRR